MKRVLAFCLAVLLALTIAYAGGELRYSEPFLSDNRGHLTNITTVENMGNIFQGAMNGIPGFGLKDSKARTGEIRYQVQGAEQLTVGFYSKYLSYACWEREEWKINPSPNYKGDKIPAYIDENDYVYIQDGKDWYQFQSVSGFLKFCPALKAPTDLQPLNLEVCAVDAQGIEHRLTGKSMEFHCVGSLGGVLGYYETRVYEIPKGTQGLILTLRFPAVFRNEEGNPDPYSSFTPYPVVVNEVVLEGSNLLFDQPPVAPEEPSVPESGGSGSSGSSGSSSSGGGSGGHTGGGTHRPDDEIILPDNQEEDTWIDRTEMPEPAEEPSQVPVSSSEPVSTEQKPSAGKKAQTTKKSDQKPEADRGPSEPEQETVIYQMERETARDRLFSLMLAGYGVIGLGAAGLLYRHIRRKK